MCRTGGVTVGLVGAVIRSELRVSIACNEEGETPGKGGEEDGSA